VLWTSLGLVRDSASTAGNADLMQFLSGVAREQIWFRRVGNDRGVNVIDGADAAAVENWYLDTQHRVGQFRASTGQALMGSQVQNLVNTMATFSPPAAGQTSLPANCQSAQQPVLAANRTA
jgi:hypothetical protein